MINPLVNQFLWPNEWFYDWVHGVDWPVGLSYSASWAAGLLPRRGVMSKVRLYTHGRWSPLQVLGLPRASQGFPGLPRGYYILYTLYSILLLLLYYHILSGRAALGQLVFFGAFCSLRLVLFCSCAIISQRCKLCPIVWESAMEHSPTR